ncbi:hypothetical protein [Streptomyces uncialis]|uniref:hypothetical protein n=1 Tax=Streptomyces uncialis TaxID=1048205 RepID=UPI002F94E188|nr:hypothetical protein OG924_37240 [Streptomyces uncialis]
MSYDRQTAEICSAVAQLAALTGHDPRVITETGAVRVETDLTDALIPRWLHLLAVLDLGATYGLRSADGHQVAWLRFELRKSRP